VDLTYSEEQALLRDSARRFLADRYPAPASGRGRAESSDDRRIWREFAGLGWLGLPLPEAFGGLNQGMVEIAILMEAFGRSLVTEPYVPTVVLGAGVIAEAGSPAQQHAVLPGVAAGEIRLALAHVEQHSRFTLAHVETRARPDGIGFMLDGRKTLVPGGADADYFVISARMSGSARDASGTDLFLLPRRTDGLLVERHATLDGTGTATVTLTDVSAGHDHVLSRSANVAAVLQAHTDRAICAICAEMVGIMEVLVEATVAHTRTRLQFGRPLAANQVLRHRMVDMSLALEEARSMALRAALLADQPDPVGRTLAASAAKVKVGRAATFVAEQAVQLHGAMGVTDELTIGAYLRKVVALDALFGPAEHHLRRHAVLSERGRAGG
jgi:alkylation response protein AidB-like acyl-CoA dehydrogenase